ncbi:MAG: molecular chaperone TorD family protein [Magnetococcales bacterium]|nr:molecular chaperone TorD family protein [Magnetococcales bacterium]
MVTLPPHEMRLLAGMLAYPGQESLAVLRALADTEAWLKDAVAELHALPLDHWQAEHTRLFINGIPKTVCPPFASAWMTKALLNEQTLDTLERLYQSVGLQFPRMWVDYLGTLLEVLAFLRLPHDPRMPSPEGVHLQVADIVWEEHLQPWLPDFARRLQSEARLELYRRVGQRLMSWVPSVEEAGA